MNAVVAFPSPVQAGPVLPVLKSSIALSDLSQQQLSNLSACVTEFRLCQQRLGHELFSLTQTLVRMKEILGSRFGTFVEDELDISVRTANRYLHLHSVMLAHFSEKGEINVVQAAQFTQNALRLLSPETPEEVVSEIRELADKGGSKIDEATVRKILESHNKGLEAALAGAQADSKRAADELDRVKTQSELQVARMQRELSANEELLRRANEQRAALETDIQNLQSQATIVSEKVVEKEVVPAGFKSTIDAVNAANQLLNDANGQKARVEEEIAAMTRKGQELAAQMAELEGGAAEFLKLKSQIDTILLKYPQVRLKSMTTIDKNIKSAMQGLGQVMIELGEQLKAAAAD